MARRQPAADGEPAARARRRRRSARRSRCGAPTALRAVPLIGARLPISFETHVDATSLAFALALGLLCGLIFGLAPALQLSRVDPQPTLRSGASTPPRSPLRNALMAVEVALALVVLLAGGTLPAQLQRDARRRTPGSGATACCSPPTICRGATSTRRVARRSPARCSIALRALPGRRVGGDRDVGAARHPRHAVALFTLEGPRADRRRARRGAEQHRDAGLLRRHGHADPRGPRLRGSARHGRAAAGRRQRGVRPPVPATAPIRSGAASTIRGRQYAITGVVRNSLYDAFGEPPTPIIYFSLSRSAVARRPRSTCAPRPGTETTARRRSASASSASSIPTLPVYDIRTLSDHIETNLIFRRIPARMFVVLGPLLLLLAAIGIYAVVAYAVSLRHDGDRRPAGARRDGAAGRGAVRRRAPDRGRRRRARRLAADVPGGPPPARRCDQPAGVRRCATRSAAGRRLRELAPRQTRDVGRCDGGAATGIANGGRTTAFLLCRAGLRR